MAESVPSTAMRGQVHLGDAAAEHVQVLLGLGLAHVVDGHAVGEGDGHELGVLGEELVEAVDQAHAPRHGVEHQRPLVRREHAAGGGDAEDEGVDRVADEAQGLIEVGADRDVVRLAAEDLAGVEAGLRAVEHGHDLVALGVADEAVGGLAVLLAEVGLAVDDGGRPRTGGARRR